MILGYLTAGICINFFSEYVTWRFSIQVQGFAELPIALYFLLENESYINIETNNATDTETIRNTQMNAGNPSTVEEVQQQPFASPKAKNKTEALSPQRSPNRSLNKIESPNRLGTKRQYSTAQLSRRSQMKRQSTRIDAVEINDLQRYCSQTKVSYIVKNQIGSIM